MFPSSNYNDSYPLELLIKKSSFLYDQSFTTTKLDDPSFLTFSSPFFDENELPLNQIFSHDQIMSTNDHVETTNPNSSKKEKAVMRCSTDQMIPNGVVPLKKRNLGAVPRKRTGKKDRHSKICTAQGIRDRRMRLSLQVARKFFDLQDLLGYDKASKTIEWLFTKSKKAIKELIKELPQHNTYHISTSEPKNGTLLSESEGYSGIDENSNLLQFSTNPHEKHGAQSPKMASKQPLVDMKVSRKKARARARRRTMEKMMMRWCRSSNPSDDIVEFGTLKNNFLESVVQEGFFQSEEDLLSLHNKSSDVGTIEKLIEGSSGSSRFAGNWFFLNHHILNSSQYAVREQLPLTGPCSNTLLFEGPDHQESAGSSTKQGVSPDYPESETRLLAYHDVGTIEKFLEGMNSRSSSTDVSSHNFPGFPETLDFVEQ